MAKKKSSGVQHVDVKLTIWKRLYFDPDKTDLEKLKEVIDGDCSFDYDVLIDEELGFTNSEIDLDSEEFIPAEENQAPTIEVFDSDGNVLHTNFEEM